MLGNKALIINKVAIISIIIIKVVTTLLSIYLI